MKGLTIETGICGNDQESSFMNATLQAHGDLEFSIATYVVSIPPDIQTEKQLRAYLEYVFGGLFMDRRLGEPGVRFEIQIGPAGG
jgi:hypothetical protein